MAQITYPSQKVVVYAFHDTGIAQAFEEAARVVREYKGNDGPYVVDEKAITMTTEGVHDFEITLPLVRDGEWEEIARG